MIPRLHPAGDCSGAPVRIQLRRTKGFRLQETSLAINGLPCVVVTRPGKYGNIFTVGCRPCEFSTALPDTCESVEEAVRCYRYYAESWIALTQGRWIEPLRGKNLACFCGLDQPCHANVLLELAHSTPPHNPDAV